MGRMGKLPYPCFELRFIIYEHQQPTTTMPYSDYDNPGEFFGAGYSLLETDRIAFTTNTHADPKALTGITTAQAAAAGGSTAQVIYALLEAMFQKYYALTSAEKPTNFSVACSNLISASTGAITKTYTVRVVVTPDTLTATNT